MGHLNRIVFVAGGTVANTILAMIYLRVAWPLLVRADNAGSAFDTVIDTAMVVPGVVIGLFYLGLFAVLIGGPVQEETAATRRETPGVRRRR